MNESLSEADLAQLDPKQTMKLAETLLSKVYFLIVLLYPKLFNPKTRLIRNFQYEKFLA